jgi:prepilin-type N-terminal cleavage/methylation domain-containing protein
MIQTTSRNNGFTLVELIVVITILAILGTIGYTSFLGYNVIARDTVRKSDINSISKAVELSKLEIGSYPVVSNIVDITFSGSTIWNQGSFGADSYAAARRISRVPIDPLTGSEYAYSTTTRTGEYQVGTILEKANLSYLPDISSSSYALDIFPVFATSFVRGNYNGRFITHTEDVSPDLKNIYVL